MSKSRMQVLSHSCYIPALDFSDFSMCEHYLYGKQAMNSHSIINKKQSDLLELVHSDVCNPICQLFPWVEQVTL